MTRGNCNEFVVELVADGVKRISERMKTSKREVRDVVFSIKIPRQTSVGCSCKTEVCSGEMTHISFRGKMNGKAWKKLVRSEKAMEFGGLVKRCSSIAAKY